MSRARIPAFILFWLAACLALLAASSCRRETPVAERPVETARKPPGSPVATPAPPSVPAQAKSAPRSLAAITAEAMAPQKRRAVSSAPPGSVRWIWRWQPADEGNPDLTGKTVSITITIDDGTLPAYSSTFRATGKVTDQRVTVDIPRSVTDGRWIGAVLKSGGYTCGKGVPERIVP